MLTNRKQQRPEVVPFDVSKLENEVLATMPSRRQEVGQQVSEYAPKLPLPSYVEHSEEVDNVGRLSAEAIIQQYEAAAKQVEALGEEIKSSSEKLMAALAEHDADMKMIAETAQEIRDRGKAIFLQIESASQITTELRRTCSELKSKIK